uniref:Uncharacterized protein n=1 Tax=Tanacetum cinerariifolium TaxID=118510 RepID=A0A699KB84_TANCI|nr:hypothetical protein [Tanacetum cinerariifolium]
MRMVGKGFSRNITPLFPIMVVQSQLGEGSAIPTDPQHTPTILQSSSSQPQKTQKHRKSRRKVTEVPQPIDSIENVTDEAVYKVLDDSLVRATTTASSLKAEQDSGNINKTKSKATPNESSSQGTNLGGGPRCQDTMGDTIAQTRVLDLEKTKTTQALKIDSLKRRVKKLEKKQRLRTHKLKRLYKVGLSARVESSDDNEDLGDDASKQERKIHDIDVDEDITLVNDQDDEQIIDATTATILVDEVSLAQALAELKHTKPKAKGIVFHEPEEPMKLQKKDQIMLDEEVALKLQAELQAEFDKEQRLARKKA